MTIASTILAQLGGNRFLAMTGAKNLVTGSDFLQFDVPASMTKERANKVRVTLAGNDTYTLAAYKFSARKAYLLEVGKVSGADADVLRQMFTRLTGLHTSL